MPPSPAHHGQEHFIRTKAAIAEALSDCQTFGSVVASPKHPIGANEGS